jgi:hypothetical protein
MTMNSEDIMKIVEYIRQSTVENKEEYFAEMYPVFKAKYPMLFKQICNDPDFDMNNLKYMLNVLDNKKDAYSADVFVGQMLFDKYVKHLDTPLPKSNS